MVRNSLSLIVSLAALACLFSLLNVPVSAAATPAPVAAAASATPKTGDSVTIIPAAAPAVVTAPASPSAPPPSRYPNLQIDGYKTWEFSKVTVTPETNTLLAQSYLGGITPTAKGKAFDWKEKMQLGIVGNLSEKLSVSYDLEQQPDMPDRYDITVTYDQTQLTFGDFNATIDGNEFATINKMMNGAMLKSKGDFYEAALISARDRSNSQRDSFTGNRGKGPYQLSHTFIVERSETVLINNELHKRDVDYTINYFDGKITFTEILKETDVIEVKYEYTSQLDLFFPVMGQKDFLGARGKLVFTNLLFGTPASLPPSPEIVNEKETLFGTAVPKTIEIISLPVMDNKIDHFPLADSSALSPAVSAVGAMPAEDTEDIQAEEILTSAEKLETSGKYALAYKPVVAGSEKVYFNDRLLKPIDDYRLDQARGLVTLNESLTAQLKSPVRPSVRIEYDYYQTAEEQEKFTGQDSRGPYNLKHKRLAPNSEIVWLNNTKLQPNLDYVMDNEKGQIIFTVAASVTSNIQVTYRYIIQAKPDNPKPDISLAVGSTYLRESAKASSDSAQIAKSESFPITASGGVIQRIYGLAGYPLVDNSETIKLAGRTLTRHIDYSLDLTKGTLTFAPSLVMAAGDLVEARYTYWKNFPASYNISGNNSLDPYYLPNRPIVYSSEIVSIRAIGEIDYHNLRRYDPDISSSYYNTGEKVYSFDYANGSFTFLVKNSLGTFDPLIIQSDTTIRLQYSYVAMETTTTQNLNHAVLGFDSRLTYKEDFHIQAQAARSDNDQFIFTIPQVDTLPGNNTKNYHLSHPPVQNTELIRLNGNLLTKDNDYIISYTTGDLSLIKDTPAPIDQIVASYQYSSGDSGSARGLAYSGLADGKIGPTQTIISSRVIRPTFSPIGTMRGSQGSEENYVDFTYSPWSNLSLNTKQEFLHNQINAIGSPVAFYVHTRRQLYQSSYQPTLDSALKVSFININTVDDIAPGTLHNYDAGSQELKAAYSFGPSSFNSLLEAGHALNKTDTVDLTNLTINRSLLLRGKNQWQPWTTTTITTDLQRRDTAISANTTGNSQRTTDALDLNINHTPSNVFSTNLGVFWQRIDEHDPGRKIGQNRKISTQVSYFPGPILKSSVSYANEETASVLINQSPTISDNINASLTSQTLANLNLTGKFGWQKSREGSLKMYRNSRYGFTATYNPWEPLSLIADLQEKKVDSQTISLLNRSLDRTQSLEIDYQLFQQLTLIAGYEIGQLESADSTNTGSGKWSTPKVGFKASPWPILTLAGSYAWQKYNYYSILGATNLVNQTREITVHAWPWPSLDIRGTYQNQILGDQISGSSLPSHNLKGGISYTLSATSKINLDLELVKTNGQLQKGLLENISNKKQILTASIDFFIPIGVVPESLVLTAKWKKVDFTDYLAVTNNFTADALIGEVKLLF